MWVVVRREDGAEGRQMADISSLSGPSGPASHHNGETCWVARNKAGITHKDIQTKDTLVPN